MGSRRTGATGGRFGAPDPQLTPPRARADGRWVGVDPMTDAVRDRAFGIPAGLGASSSTGVPVGAAVSVGVR